MSGRSPERRPEIRHKSRTKVRLIPSDLLPLHDLQIIPVQRIKADAERFQEMDGYNNAAQKEIQRRLAQERPSHRPSLAKSHK